jgi:hypothetical protein
MEKCQLIWELNGQEKPTKQRAENAIKGTAGIKALSGKMLD